MKYEQGIMYVGDMEFFVVMCDGTLSEPWVNYRGFNSLAIETQLHATSHVFCFMCFLNKVPSLAVSQPKNSVYSYIQIRSKTLRSTHDVNIQE